MISIYYRNSETSIIFKQYVGEYYFKMWDVEAFPIVRRLCAESNVVGFELVELNPLVDPTYVSAMNANRIVRECLTGMAMRKMGLTDKYYLSPLSTGHGQKN